jgi:hypothetical protein
MTDDQQQWLQMTRPPLARRHSHPHVEGLGTGAAEWWAVRSHMMRKIGPLASNVATVSWLPVYVCFYFFYFFYLLLTNFLCTADDNSNNKTTRPHEEARDVRTMRKTDPWGVYNVSWAVVSRFFLFQVLFHIQHLTPHSVAVKGSRRRRLSSFW